MSVEFSDTEWRVYDVEADSLAAAAQVILQMDEPAEAEWFPSYEYTTSLGRLTSAAVTVRMRVTMPHWTGYHSAPLEEQDEWTRFCAALRDHEQSHLELVRRHLTDVDRQLVGNSVTAAERSWEQALARLKSASQAYDGETDHGRRQGTIINFGIDGTDMV